MTGNILGWDIQSGNSTTIGKHNGGIVKVIYISNMNMLVSFSIDKTFKFWDLKSH